MDNHLPEATPSSSSDFVPPRHWLGPEELEASYWSNPKVREKRGQEFAEKPVELIDFIDRTDKAGLARREFLTIMGASMALGSLSCARRPVHKIIPYVVKPEEITLGVPNWYASTYKENGTSCGILVKTREGRPIKLEGNPDHPMNQGALSARAQASLLGLYDPDRLTGPRARARGTAASTESSWEAADAAIQSKLKTLAGTGRVRVLSEEIQSDTTRRLIGDFLSSFSSGEHIEYEPLALEELSEAQLASYGTDVVPHYRFEAADLVVSLGGDFIGTSANSVEYGREFFKKRKLDSAHAGQAKMSKLVCFESMMTLTGAAADERFPVRPGDELKVALALAHELILTQKRSSHSGDASVISSLQEYSPEKVAADIGFKDSGARIKSLANELWANRGRGLVLGGSIQAKTADATALQIAINLLNSALENEGVTVDGTASHSTRRSKFVALKKLLGEMQAGKVDVLIIYRANPSYYLSRAVSGLDEAMKKVPLVVSVVEHEDETSVFADYVLPDHHFLENWGDASPRQGLVSVQQPAIAPLHSSRAFEDSLLVWIKGAGLRASTLATQSPDWHGYLQAVWKGSIYQQHHSAGSFEQFWEGALRKGVLDSRTASSKVSARSFRVGSLAQLPKFASGPTSGLTLALYSTVALHDGTCANNPWLQELPDPISSITWDNYLNVSPETAKRLAIAENDVIELKSEDLRVELPVHIQPGLHDSVVAVAVGYGRRSVGNIGNLAGVNVFPFVRQGVTGLQYSGQAVSIEKTGKFYRLAPTQWHTASEERPVINDITLAEFRKNPGAVSHTDPELRMEKVPSIWPEFEYKGYRWGMTIDLTSCTGCSACMIACQAENNIPVVGRQQVRNGRNMHWIRIDRYYSGTPENPDLIFQPMLCQHCENAPCETVCPVLATVHNDEGLNIQVYNRCVGTRYCQNNCPYKVRRFNFFDHWKSYEGTMNLAWNPDVTVRTRGIMEKCTFCVQRIRDVKDRAKDRGESVADGTLRTACQQTCPTDAIVFGDINDPKSKVSLLREDQRAFRVLETLNTKPSISYLTKVRNKESASGKKHGEAGVVAPGSHAKKSVKKETSVHDHT